MHVIQLGQLHDSEPTPDITVQDPVTDEARSYTLTPRLLDLIRRVDPVAADQPFTADERRILRNMAGIGVIALVPDDAPFTRFDFIPATRADILFDAALEEGYRLTSELGGPFELSESGARFLHEADGRRTLGEIMQSVRDRALADDDERREIEEDERRGISFDDLLRAEAFRFAKACIGHPALSLEPGSACPVDEPAT
ncbi:hypothetical protein ACR8AL_05605 [Clavibacter sepedonicus]|uniref:Uncharacterized protein n=1 Tax=Clavibacter sepedonicus TaxID=31964 RepID=B0RB13_CLASE|nr:MULTISPECIES: hypothetical protein [Clavibacter]MBD5380672.1 hypothetical protein [Clavibacter sp.]OQJ48386.1 hypothetical protein B5P19_09000 [Clavibacter sepedonicus]OQJ53868.1 hypothetical protein B5P20_06840 [Clavibacter sepedonicus]UUK65383.1 hypothetical protein LRE50_14080 [Clavibacter sepedonicus]CAQ02861.1 hypothetical protein CMS2789 [Clavibacter sepedonicus]